MELRRYLFENRLTQKKFAEIIKYYPQYLRGVMYGRLKPGKRMLEAIELATHGTVTKEEMMKLYKGGKDD